MQFCAGFKYYNLQQLSRRRAVQATFDYSSCTRVNEQIDRQVTPENASLAARLAALFIISSYKLIKTNFIFHR